MVSSLHEQLLPRTTNSNSANGKKIPCFIKTLLLASYTIAVIWWSQGEGHPPNTSSLSSSSSSSSSHSSERIADITPQMLSLVGENNMQEENEQEKDGSSTTTSAQPASSSASVSSLVLAAPVAPSIFEMDEERSDLPVVHNYCNGRELRQPPTLNRNTPSACLVSERVSIPRIHDSRGDEVRRHYEFHMSERVHNHEKIGTDLPELHILAEFYPINYVVWGPVEGPRVLMSAWDRTGSYVEGSCYVNPKEQTRTTSTLEPLVLDDPTVSTYVGFSMWFPSNYEHYITDHLPTIAYLRLMYAGVNSNQTKFLLVDAPLAKQVLSFLDASFVDNQVIWIKPERPVEIHRGSLNLPEPMPRYPVLWGCQRMQHFLRGWIHSQLPMVPEKRIVLYYSRRQRDDESTRHQVQEGILDHEDEQMIISKLREGLETKYKEKRPEQEVVVVYEHEVNSMTIPERYDLFRSAATIVGARGPGMTANLAWVAPLPNSCLDRVRLLEILPSPDADTTSNSSSSPLAYHSMHLRWRQWPVEFHIVLQQADGSINAVDIDSALKIMWGR